MGKQLRKHSIYLAQYGYLEVCFIESKSMKSISKHLECEFVNGYDFDGSAFVIGRVVYVALSTKSRYFNSSTLAHELIHAKNFIATLNGIEWERSNDEGEAYLVTFLFEEGNRFYSKNKNYKR